MKAIKALLTIVTLILGVSFSNAATCTAIGSGNWYNPAIWSCGVAPGCGDLVTIPAGIVVNMDEHVMIDETSMPVCTSPTYIRVFGTLRFVTGKKMELACGSAVEIMPGGLLQDGTGGGSSNWLEICDVRQWQSSDGDVPGYHLFGSPIPLPVALIAFETVNVGSMVEVSWELASERSVSHYRVEFSRDGTDWETVATVASRGDHSEGITYTTSVPAQSVKLGYFRLINTDLDGTSTALSLKSHTFIVTTYATAYPNPVNQGTAVTVRTGSEAIVDIPFDIVDVNGRILQQGLIVEGTAAVTIETAGMDHGVYMVRFADNGLQNVRIVVE